MQISAPVLDALHSNSPIVALESTIITHGLPSNDDPTNPTNLKCALQLEQTVRDNGATPATIALIDGKVHIGLDQEQLVRLANSPNESQTNSIKTGERDVANVLAMGKGTIGGTTVSATLFLAHMAGISFFGTGGLGGCHRGSELCEYSAYLFKMRVGVDKKEDGSIGGEDVYRKLIFLFFIFSWLRNTSRFFSKRQPWTFQQIFQL